MSSLTSWTLNNTSSNTNNTWYPLKWNEMRKSCKIPGRKSRHMRWNEFRRISLVCANYFPYLQAIKHWIELSKDIRVGVELGWDIKNSKKDISQKRYSRRSLKIDDNNFAKYLFWKFWFLFLSVFYIFRCWKWKFNYCRLSSFGNCVSQITLINWISSCTWRFSVSRFVYEIRDNEIFTSLLESNSNSNYIYFSVS